MGGWGRQRTTSYGPRSTGKVGRYSSETPPPAAHISYKPEQVGTRFGWVTIIDPEKRCTAAKQRCENPKDANYKNYGARGIQFRFPSVTDAAICMIETNGLPDRSLELDRIDVNGHYEPGNLRWVTHQQNSQNQRRFLEK